MRGEYFSVLSTLRASNRRVAIPVEEIDFLNLSRLVVMFSECGVSYRKSHDPLRRATCELSCRCVALITEERPSGNEM
jgi:hypothetical protein